MTSSYLLLNQLRFHYLHWNHGGGRPIVFHHGLASNARIWEMVAERLVRHDYRLYAPDARGHGLTDKPEDGYNHETVISDLAAFINACQLEQPVIIGHSWGGQVVLGYAARFTAGPLAPAGIVLVDGGVTQLDDRGATWEMMRAELEPPPLAGMPLEEFQTRLRGWTAAWNPSDQALATILSNFEISAEDTIAPRLTYERHMQIVRSIWDFKTYSYFPRVRCPALMIPAQPPEPISTRDALYLQAKQRGVARAQESVHNFQIHWMLDTIHDIPLQRPDELAGLIAGFAHSLD